MEIDEGDLFAKSGETNGCLPIRKIKVLKPSKRLEPDHLSKVLHRCATRMATPLFNQSETPID